LDVNTVADQGR